MEPTTIKLLADALAALMAAKDETNHGFVADHCDNAMREIAQAIKLATVTDEIEN
jgi:hypothetical protein